MQYPSQRRFSEFEALHASIYSVLHMHSTFGVPKTLFSPSEQVKRERCGLLTGYMTGVVRQAIRLGAPYALCAFLGVDASIFLQPPNPPPNAAVPPGAPMGVAVATASAQVEAAPMQAMATPQAQAVAQPMTQGYPQAQAVAQGYPTL